MFLVFEVGTERRALTDSFHFCKDLEELKEYTKDKGTLSSSWNKYRIMEMQSDNSFKKVTAKQIKGWSLGDEDVS